MNQFRNIIAGSRVLYDKIHDKATQLIYGQDLRREPQIRPVEKLESHNGFLNIELYTTESDAHIKRLYPESGYLVEFNTFIGEPTHVIDNIYLGSAYNAASKTILDQHNIKFIINATKEITNYHESDPNLEYVRYALYDNNTHSIGTYLDESYKWITEKREKSGNILVHCYMGASRSASIVIYYLMKEHQYTFDEAVTFLRNKRPTVNPTFKLTNDLAQSMVTPKTSNSESIDSIDNLKDTSVSSMDSVKEDDELL